MAIKEIPVKLQEYFKSLRQYTTNKKEKLIVNLNKIKKENNLLYSEIKNNLEEYTKDFEVSLLDFEEFVNNKYIDGKLLKLAKAILSNKSNNYRLEANRYDIFRYSKNLNTIDILEKDIAFCNKILSLTMKEYSNILESFYTQVHKEMIINGKGYAFSGDLGWICINRCKFKKRGKYLNHQATRRKKEQLIKEGKRIYNKDEEEWCKKNGIKYEYEDYREYLDIEYFYEIPLIACRLPNGNQYKFETADRRGRCLRGKTNDMLLEETKGDKEKICSLPVDIKTKINICVKADTLLYTKFIRNENQESFTYSKINRKNR